MESSSDASWNKARAERQARITAAAPLLQTGKAVDTANTVRLLETIIKPGDKVNVEGDNQKQDRKSVV